MRAVRFDRPDNVIDANTSVIHIALQTHNNIDNNNSPTHPTRKKKKTPLTNADAKVRKQRTLA
jgi:hypothetical protein